MKAEVSECFDMYYWRLEVTYFFSKNITDNTELKKLKF